LCALFFISNGYFFADDAETTANATTMTTATTTEISTMEPSLMETDTNTSKS